MNNNKIRQYTNSLFFNSQQKFRNGWWMLLFVALVVITRPLYSFLKPSLIDSGVSETVLEALSPVLISLVTWICLRLRKERFNDVGLALNSQWCIQLLVGCLISLGQIGLIVAVFIGFDAVSFSYNTEINTSVLLSSLYVMLCAVVLEELLFRGFLFQRLADGTSFVFAQLAFALVFAFGHWDNPDMSGMVKWVASLDLALAAMVFGLAYYRTRSLALPIGLHLGWNYFQGHVFGFGVSGYELNSVLTPEFTGYPIWFTGGSFGPEASILSVAVDLLLLLVLWRWQGSKSIRAQKVSEQANQDKSDMLNQLG